MSEPLRIDVLTVFPGMLRGFFEESMLRRAARMGAVAFRRRPGGWRRRST